MRPLTTEMTDASSRPYFLWDEDVTIGELHQILAQGSEYDRNRLLAKMLREARDVDAFRSSTLRSVRSTTCSSTRAVLPGGVEPAELRGYIDDVVVRLRRAALPAR
jgi:hypothetical protein